MINMIGMVCRKLMKVVQNFYANSRVCVRVGNDVSEWFPVNVGLRQGCEMSPLLFNVFMYGVVRVVNVRVLGKGLELVSANGGRFEINQLLFADDTALVSDSEEKLCRLISEFGRACESRSLRVNVGKNKVFLNARCMEIVIECMCFCTNGDVRSRDMGYEECLEKESEY